MPEDLVLPENHIDRDYRSLRENIGNSLVGLVDRIARWTEGGELHTTSIPGLSLFRQYEPTEPIGGMYEPSICLVAQGTKRALLEDDAYVYDADHYLITSVHLPTIVQIIDASPNTPYLGLRLKFDMCEVSQLMTDSNLPAPRKQKSSRGMTTGETTLPLVDALNRLIDLLAHEEDTAIHDC